jgi:hypothetical protein
MQQIWLWKNRLQGPCVCTGVAWLAMVHGEAIFQIATREEKLCSKEIDTGLVV